MRNGFAHSRHSTLFKTIWTLHPPGFSWCLRISSKAKSRSAVQCTVRTDTCRKPWSYRQKTQMDLSYGNKEIRNWYLRTIPNLLKSIFKFENSLSLFKKLLVKLPKVTAMNSWWMNIFDKNIITSESGVTREMKT